MLSNAFEDKSFSSFHFFSITSCSEYIWGICSDIVKGLVEITGKKCYVIHCYQILRYKIKFPEFESLIEFRGERIISWFF